MRALLGLVRPDAGTLTILGLDAARDSRDIRRRVGYMPEGECLPRDPSAHVFVVHLAELRGLPRRAAVLRASEVLFQVGLEEERSRPIGTFSTGMRQRVKLAQALVHGPELVVLDEPTAGLDPAGREEMLQLVRRLSLDLGVRVLLSSHVLEDVARTCDAVVVLRDGHVVTSGLLDELRGADATAIAVRVTATSLPSGRRWQRAAWRSRSRASGSSSRAPAPACSTPSATPRPTPAPACASSSGRAHASRTSSSAPWRSSDGRARPGRQPGRGPPLHPVRGRPPGPPRVPRVVCPAERAARARGGTGLARQADPVRR